MSDAIGELKSYVLRQATIVDKPGKLLYSAGSTLKPHDIYFLGTKPGGTLPTTIRESLSDLDDGRNEYLDYQWEGRPPGEHKLQKQVRRFVEGLGYGVRDVPATNIVFTRDRSIDSHPDLDGDAVACWPIHRLILKLVQPKAIIVFGSGEEKSAFAYLRRFLSPRTIESIPAGQQPFSCHRFEGFVDGRLLRVAAVPHLTRYSPYTRPNIMRWVREYIA